MTMDILVNINRFGGPLTKEQTDFILKIVQNIDSGKETLGKENNTNEYIAARQLIEWLEISPKSITPDMLERYTKMSPEELYIPFTLAKPEKIEQRITAPLVSAKRLGCIGEFLASIALSGLVGEMLAILIWDLNAAGRMDTGGAIIKDQRLIGEGFSKLKQSQRISMLQAFGYVSSINIGLFKELAERRNNLLHGWTDSMTRNQIEQSVIRSYSCATLLMKDVLGIKLADAGSLKVDEKVMMYLQKNGGLM